MFAFAFLLASFPVRTPSLWYHLGAGRQLASGQFSSLSPVWLFDLASYFLHATIGGGGLVAVKAAAVGALGVLLYRTGRGRGGHSFLASVCAGLAVLALSLSANVRPLTVSLVCLGAVVWWLRDEGDDDRPAEPGRIPWHLFGLFLIWANADRGFVTGVGLVLAVWLGRLLDVRAGRAARGFGWVKWWPLGVVGAALLNPTITREFPLPAELDWLASLTADGPAADDAVVATDTGTRSPLSRSYASRYADSPAVLAYYPLLFGGLASFVLNYRRLRWQRFLPWVGMAVLSVVTDRAVPVFAVVGGPVLALNLGELFGRGPEVGVGRRRWWAALPAVVFGVLFLVAAWPGWLQGPPYEPRRWAEQIPGSPEPAAQKIAEYRADGRFADGTRTLHLTPESQKAFEWFCPSDDGAYDAELASALARGEPPVNLAARMAEGRFTRVVLYHQDVNRLRNPLAAVLPFRTQWPLLFVRGGVAVFGWQSPTDPPKFRGADLTDPWFDLSEQDRRSVPTARYDVRRGDDLGLFERVRDQFVTPTPGRSIHRDEAALLLMMADISRGFVPLFNRDRWPIEQWVGMAGAAGAFANPVSAAADAALRLNYLTHQPVDPSAPVSPLARAVDFQFGFAQFTRPDLLVGPLYASIRASRRALAETPNDPAAHILLGEAYLRVLDSTADRAWAAPDKFRQAAELRQAQAAAALTRGVALSRTPPYRAHRLLAEMYLLINYLDLTLEHLKKARDALAAYRQARTAGTAEPGDSPRREIEDAEWNALDGQIRRLEEVVRRQTERFESETKNTLAVGRIQVASSLDLQGLALDLLLKSDVAAFGAEGTALELNLLLRTGRADDVIDWTADNPTAGGPAAGGVKDIVGANTYHWYRAQALAASGATADADAELAAIEGGAAALIPDRRLLADTAAVIAAETVLAESPRTLGVVDAVGRVIARSGAEAKEISLRQQLRGMAEVSVLRALLAAEAGDLSAAATYCRAAMEFTPGDPDGNENRLHAIARDLLGQIVAHQRRQRLPQAAVASE